MLDKKPVLEPLLMVRSPSIFLTKSHVLQISYVGSETQKVDVADLSSVKVILKSSSQALTDVVIIGYGSARKKDLTGAVSSIKAKDFNQGVINSPDQLLTNKVPGLEVTSTSGQPGVAQLPFKSGVLLNSFR